MTASPSAAAPSWKLRSGAAPRSDPSALADCHAACFEGPAGWWSAASFADLTEDRTLWWCEALSAPQAALVGFAAMRLVGAEAELLTLCRRPDWARRGLGQALLSRALTQAAANGGEAMFLEVAVSNLPAIALYHAAGFRPVGRRPRYYRRLDGGFEDALVLRIGLCAG